jgi:hypothetical protein
VGSASKLMFRLVSFFFCSVVFVNQAAVSFSPIVYAA